MRIEDDILITEEGYENLTTALKGEEALKVINDDEGVGRGIEGKERKEMGREGWSGWFW